MERFIVFYFIKKINIHQLFKIQYGEIYRRSYIVPSVPTSIFKIQYGEIYRIWEISFNHLLNRFKIQYGEIYSVYSVFNAHYTIYLKSSMERFIGARLEEVNT